MITAGSGNDYCRTEAQADTLTFSADGDLNSNDTVDGGDGTDTLALTISTDLSTAFTLTSVENVDLTANNGITTIDFFILSVTNIEIQDGVAMLRSA